MSIKHILASLIAAFTIVSPIDSFGDILVFSDNIGDANKDDGSFLRADIPFDISAVSLLESSSFVTVSIDLSASPGGSLPSSNQPNSVVGFLEFNLDGDDETTPAAGPHGFTAFEEALSASNKSDAELFGAEISISLGSERDSPGIVSGISSSEDFKASLSFDASDNLLIIEVPISVFDGSLPTGFDLAVIVGDGAGFSDSLVVRSISRPTTLACWLGLGSICIVRQRPW